MTSPLEINAIQCDSCLDVIESTHVHDFRSCQCGNVYVDGGVDYQRIGWMPGCTYTVIKTRAELDELLSAGTAE